jgi:hypothetical protein
MKTQNKHQQTKQAQSDPSKNLFGTRCQPLRSSEYASTVRPSRISWIDTGSPGSLTFAQRLDPVTWYRKNSRLRMVDCLLVLTASRAGINPSVNLHSTSEHSDRNSCDRIIIKPNRIAKLALYHIPRRRGIYPLSSFHLESNCRRRLIASRDGRRTQL